MPESTYATARSILSFVIILGWISVGLGVLLTFFAVVAMMDLSGRGLPAGVAALIPGLGLAIAGLVQVALGAIGQAVFDQADLQREILRHMRLLTAASGIDAAAFDTDAEAVSSPASNPRTVGSLEPDREGAVGGLSDAMGFDSNGRRVFKGVTIQRVGNRFRVGDRDFATLGQAKRHISASG